MTQLLQLLGTRERRQEGSICETSLELRRVDRDSQSPDPDRLAGIGVAQRSLHRAEVAVGRTHEEDGDLLSLQTVRHDELVGTLDECPVGRTGLGERVHLRLERIAPALGTANVLLEAITLRIAEPV